MVSPVSPPNWLQVLNEHSEWRSDEEVCRWFSSLTNNLGSNPSKKALQNFSDTLCQIRKLIYDNHFGKELSLSWLNNELQNCQFELHLPSEFPGLPALRSPTTKKDADALLESFRGALIIQFALSLSEALSSGEALGVRRCEGLYRDSKAASLSLLPEVSERIETLWRQEIPVLVEKSLELDAEIQRCADLFSEDTRSKYCSDKCRFSTFQIIKQLKEPNYLADKQRRYRQKKT